MAVNKTQKFTPQEISQIKDFQEKYNQITVQLGQLTISEIKLKEQKDILKSNLTSLEQEEQKIAQDLTKKYGKGSIDIETGEFTPTE
mgnify:CR=1 FL=1